MQWPIRDMHVEHVNVMANHRHIECVNAMINQVFKNPFNSAQNAREKCWQSHF